MNSGALNPRSSAGAPEAARFDLPADVIQAMRSDDLLSFDSDEAFYEFLGQLVLAWKYIEPYATKEIALTDDTKQLLAFYGVADIPALIEQQVQHVQSLQVKLKAYEPKRNHFPKSPREG